MKRTVLAALIFPALAACSGTGNQELAYTPPPLFENPVDPSDTKLHNSVQAYLAAAQGPKNSQYEYSRVDLNGDGLREGVVLFNLPHSYWCGWSGCTMAIFEAGDDNFTLLSETARIRGPIVIGDSRTNGWGDIGVRMTGTDRRDYNILLKYDGTAYPYSPERASTMPYDLASLGGTRLFP